MASKVCASGPPVDAVKSLQIARLVSAAVVDGLLVVE
jgi:hypothetical protein